jgi:hypothetical protein
MADEQIALRYWVWGEDRIAYGPVELPGLVGWLKQGRLRATGWVFPGETGRWTRADEVPELKLFFAGGAGAGRASGVAAHPAALKPGNLRRIRLFAEMDPDQLESLVDYMEVVRVHKFAQLFRKGDHGDAMYFVLEGEVRALTMIEGKETTLFTMRPGDSFGELALLIQGPRTADMAANEDSVLLRLPAAAFEKILREAPALAAPFLLALARVIGRRSLELGKKYESSIRSARALADLRF